MTEAVTHLDLSVLENLDFEIQCGLDGHGEEDSCDTGPAVWIAKCTHKCYPKIMPVCDRFKSLMDTLDPIYVGSCGCSMPREEFFEVVERIRK